MLSLRQLVLDETRLLDDEDAQAHGHEHCYQDLPMHYGSPYVVGT